MKPTGYSQMVRSILILVLPLSQGALGLAAQQRSTANAGDSLPKLKYCNRYLYPNSQHRGSTGGYVQLQAVIDTTGRPEPSTLEVVESSDESLEAGATEYFMSCRFWPAVSGGRPARVWITQRLTFMPGFGPMISDSQPQSSH